MATEIKNIQMEKADADAKINQLKQQLKEEGNWKVQYDLMATRFEQLMNDNTKGNKRTYSLL